MLERFRQVKDQEIANLAKLAKTQGLPKPFSGNRVPFQASLVASTTPLAIIAEYKQASPSKGPICLDLAVEDVVLAYAKYAKAISILTEEVYFQGHLTFIDRAKAALQEQAIPLLRKDFLYDPLQVAMTAATQASALLLIVRLIADTKKLANLISYSASFGLESVVEVFDADDLRLARASGAKIIQVNTRDLETFTVDNHEAFKLIKAYPPKDFESWILASGITCRDDLILAAKADFKAALIGTRLMQGGNPGKALEELVLGDQDAN